MLTKVLSNPRLKARATRPTLPRVLLANVRSLENKMYELKARTTTQREIKECCALIFTETWTRDNMPDSAIQLQTHSVYCRDHTEASGKNKGGGVCVYINNKWRSDVQVVEKHCSVDTEVLMIKCRPFYLQREFSAVFVLAVYILPRANQTAVLRLLHDTISKHKTTHPDAVFVVAGDFNHFILRTVLPKYHQHVSYPTRDNKILDQVYSNVKGTYKAAPCPHFSQSDHISMFLYPSYRQLLEQAPPPRVSKTVKVWNKETDLVLQDCFNSTDWEVFKTAAMGEDCTVDLEKYASVVTGYINTVKCYKTYPNQKPWINCDVRSMLRARSTTFASGASVDPSEKPSDSMEWSLRDTTPAWIPSECGSACNTSQTTSSAARRSQLATAHYQMSWVGSMLALTPSTPTEGLYQQRQHRDLHSRWHQVRCGRALRRTNHIVETQVERVKTFKFLGIHISEDLFWSHNTQHIARKLQQWLYFLRNLKKFVLSTKLLSKFYKCTVGSTLTNSITVWFGNCKVQERKALQRVIKTAQYICGAAFPSLQDIYNTRVTKRAHNITKDTTHPQHTLFTLLPYGRRYRSVKGRTTRFKKQFLSTGHQAAEWLCPMTTQYTQPFSTIFALCVS